MESKTLIIITPGFPKDERDTVCLPSQQLFVRCVQELHPTLTIKVISLHYPYHRTKYRWHGIEVYPLNGKAQSGIKRPLLWYRCYQLLRDLKKQNDIVGIISFWCNETAFIGNMFSKRNNIEHKIWISGQDARKDNFFVRWIKPASNDLIAMSHFLKREFENNHGIIVDHVITNGVAHTFQNVSKDIDVIGAGSLIALKQYNIFLEVIAEIKNQKPKVAALLFGKGPEENALRKRIRALRLEDNVKLMGEVDHDSLMNWMNRSKILLHPSTYEGYSTVCLEALANGCHVVSFTYPEQSETKHWYHVKDEHEMTAVADRILASETDYSPVFGRDMKTSAKAIISLFEHQA